MFGETLTKPKNYFLIGLPEKSLEISLPLTTFRNVSRGFLRFASYESISKFGTKLKLK